MNLVHSSDFPVSVPLLYFFHLSSFLPPSYYLICTRKEDGQPRNYPRKHPRWFLSLCLLLRSIVGTDRIGSSSSLWCFLVFFLLHFFWEQKQRPAHNSLTRTSLHSSIFSSLSPPPTTSCPVPVKISQFKREFRGQTRQQSSAKIETSTSVIICIPVRPQDRCQVRRVSSIPVRP